MVVCFDGREDEIEQTEVDWSEISEALLSSHSKKKGLFKKKSKSAISTEKVLEVTQNLKEENDKLHKEHEDAERMALELEEAKVSIKKSTKKTESLETEVEGLKLELSDFKKSNKKYKKEVKSHEATVAELSSSLEDMKGIDCGFTYRSKS